MKSRRIAIFMAIFTLFNMAASFAHPVTPAFIVERQLDSSMFGVALAAMMTMNFLFAPFWGRLCSYIPTKWIHLITCVGYAVGQIFFLMARSEAMVVAARMFGGLFVGGAFTSFTNYVINIAPDKKARDAGLTLLVTIQSVGGACGYFIGGMLGLISTATAFVVQIVCLALSGVLCAFFCIDDTAYKVKPTTPLALREANPFLAFVKAREFMTPMLGLIFAIVAISSIGQNSYEQCFNYYIKDQYGMSSAYNGTFKALIALMTLALNSTVCVTLQKKTDINRTFLYVLFACAALISTILIFDNRVLFVGIYILYSSVNVIRLPLLQSMIAARSDASSRNSLMGFNQSMTSLGGIFGALFAGLIYKQGPMLPFILAFCAYVLSAVIGGIYVRKYRAAANR